MAWVTDFIPQGRRNRPGTIIEPLFITVHDTGNTAVGAGARAHGMFLKEHSDPVTPPGVRSWHATVDDKDIVHHLPFNEMAYHAGSDDGNRLSIGIEICQNANSDRHKAEDSAARLVADLLHQFAIPLENVVQHNRWVETDCPEVLKHRWGWFIATVAMYAGVVCPDTTDWKVLAEKLQAKLQAIRELTEG